MVIVTEKGDKQNRLCTVTLRFKVASTTQEQNNKWIIENI